jgi:hypothetical protein
MKHHQTFTRLTHAEKALVTFEHRSLPAYLALCLGLACGFAILPAVFTGAFDNRVNPGAPMGKAQHRIAPGWFPGEPSAVASSARVKQAVLETRP